MSTNTPDDLILPETPHERTSGTGEQISKYNEELADVLGQETALESKKENPLMVKGAPKAGMQIVVIEEDGKKPYNFVSEGADLNQENCISEKWFAWVGPFSENDKYAMVADLEDSRKFNLLTIDGKIFSGRGFDKITPTAEGFRQVTNKKEDGKMQWTWINTTAGELLSSAQEPEKIIWVDGSSEFSEGLASFQRGEKRNYIDIKGNILLEDDVDETRNFKNGVAVIGKKDGEEPKFMYIDTKGAFLLSQWIESKNSQEFTEQHPYNRPLGY